MKRLSLILVLFIIGLMIMPLFIQADPTNATPVNLVQDAGNIISWFKEDGWNLFKNLGKIYAVMAFLIGTGFLIITFTTTKKDDIWYGKYILKPFRFVGNLLTFFKIDISTPAKKKKK